LPSDSAASGSGGIDPLAAARGGAINQGKGRKGRVRGRDERGGDWDPPYKHNRSRLLIIRSSQFVKTNLGLVYFKKIL
jgi:hypothetical protein